MAGKSGKKYFIGLEADLKRKLLFLFLSWL